MKCTNSDCTQLHNCYTYVNGEGEEINLPTLKFPRTCKYFYPINLDKQEEIVKNLLNEYYEENEKA